MTRVALLFLVAILIVPARAQQYRDLKDLEDNADHWMFEFDMSSKKPLGSRDDVRSITALCLGEAKRDSGSAPTSGVMIAWPSASQAITRVDFVDAMRGTLLFVLEKKDVGWLIIHQFHIPNPLRKQHTRPNQTMKPTGPLRCNFSDIVASPCGGLSLSR